MMIGDSPAVATFEVPDGYQLVGNTLWWAQMEGTHLAWTKCDQGQVLEAGYILLNGTIVQELTDDGPNVDAWKTGTTTVAVQRGTNTLELRHKHTKRTAKDPGSFKYKIRLCVIPETQPSPSQPSPSPDPAQAQAQSIAGPKPSPAQVHRPTQARAQVQSHPSPKPRPKSIARPEPESKPEPKSVAGPKPEPKSRADPAQPKPSPSPGPEPKPKSKSVTGPKPKPKPSPITRPEPSPSPSPSPDPSPSPSPSPDRAQARAQVRHRTPSPSPSPSPDPEPEFTSRWCNDGGGDEGTDSGRRQNVAGVSEETEENSARALLPATGMSDPAPWVVLTLASLLIAMGASIRSWQIQKS
jgi:hypothetical protein